METPSQLTILNEQPRTKRTYNKVCDECGKDYESVSQGAKFCSNTCRGRYFRKMKTSSPTSTVRAETKSAQPASITPVITGLPPHLQIAIDLLKKDAERMEKAYNEERDRRRKVDAELAKLKEETRDKEHKKALQGLEEKKPDLLDRLANLPTPILEQFAPVLGRLAGMLIPGGDAAQPVAGVGGQLDEGQIQFLNWIASLPEAIQKNFIGLLSTLSNMDEQTLALTLSQFQNLLTTGTTIKQKTSSGYDETMFGT